MNIKRFLSALLSVLMISTMLVSAFMIQASAEDAGAGEGGPVEEPEPYEIAVKEALTAKYTSAQDKLNKDPNMKLMVTGFGYEIYCNQYTGEVAYKNKATGQILLSNPYDVANSHGAAETKKRLLSQIAIRFTDNDTDKYMYSYTEAAERGQIAVKHIKNGIRVEYTMGREETRYLVPGMMEKTRFEELILQTMELNAGGKEAWAYTKIIAFYMLKDPNAPNLSERSKLEMFQEYPITKKMPVYVLSLDTSDREKRELEGYIKTFCPEYGYDDLQYDHELTGYVAQGKDPPLFKLSLEYTLDEDGLVVRLPANGLRFDESNYKLQYVSPLQYFGAGNMYNDGYIFYPDGSGAITYFEDMFSGPVGVDGSIVGINGTITGKIYGADYAYHEITGQHQEAIRMPVFGVIDSTGATKTVIDETTGLPTTMSYTQYRGYMAILEDGDALANVTAAFGGTQHMFASVYPTYYPRPSDEYNLADSLSVGENSTWTVESDRKYTGNYTLRIKMLADPNLVESKVAEEVIKAEDAKNYYDASWLGMAIAYRDYLVKQKVLTKLTAEDVEEKLPLYIETFGSITDTKKILSVPVEVDVPLTTFDDIKTMYNDLSKDEIGITNINFKLTGYTNGGMYYTYPTKIKWMKAVGGKSGYNDLLEFAEQTGAGIFPDFDFMYINITGAFDGISMKRDVVRTIDNRYSSKRIYDAVFQEFISYFDYCVSPLSLNDFCDKFMKKLAKYEKTTSISVSTLGSDLNSDFNEDNLSHREDSKTFITEVLGKLDAEYSLLGSGGNAYTLKYFDHLIDVSLNSSNFTYSSTSVPFVGATLHGYINFAGTPINMAGDIDLEFLKAIENGANLYFILSYQNTNLLKEDMILSKYYSVNYEIWKDELISRYTALNEAIGDLQTALITDHQFVIGSRIPTDEEKEKDAASMEEQMKAGIEREVQNRYNEAVAKLKEDLDNGLIDPGSVQLPDKEAIRAEVLADIESGDTVITIIIPDYNLYNDKLVYITYTKDDGKEVKFLLNYNIYDVEVVVDGYKYKVGSYSYLRLPEGGGK